MHEIHPDLFRMFFSSQTLENPQCKVRSSTGASPDQRPTSASTPRKTSMSHQNQWLEDEMFFQNDWFSPGNMSNENIAKEVITFGGFLKWWYPQIILFDRVFHYFHHPFWGTPIFGNIHFATRLCNDDPWNLWKYHGVGLGWLLQISTRDNVHSIQVDNWGLWTNKQTNKQKKGCVVPSQKEDIVF